MSGPNSVNAGGKLHFKPLVASEAPFSEPKAPESAKRAIQTDQLKTKDPTVGEYVEEQIRQAGEELKTDAEVVAITAVAAPVVAVIMARHMNEARERVAKLPMDPEGKWKAEAAKILAEERQEAKKEILALPGQVVQGVKDGANAVAEGVDAVVDGVSSAAQWTQEKVDAAAHKAQEVWGGVTGAAAQAWSYAKVAVPKAFSELFTDVKVAAIAINPLGAGPSAVIVGNHMAKAYDRIMKLPMDPEGQWKGEAARIIAEEQAAAKQEILDLPSRAYHAVADTASDVYEGAKNGLIAAGHWIGDQATAAGHAVVETAQKIEHAVEEKVQQAEHAVSEGVKKTRRGIGGLFQSFGKWIAGG